MSVAAATACESNDARFFGHPRGLAYLAFTEAWERFSFSGMQALLVLYMVDQLLQPGHFERVLGLAGLQAALQTVYGPLEIQPLSSVLFGLYTSLVFLMPVFGGLLGDKVFGQHAMVMTGAILMASGHFLMAFEPSFLFALLLLILGCGCLKGNISTQVNSLYVDGDRRRTDAFQIFSIGINFGVIVAPLVCGTLGEIFGWHYGFAAAGIGMLIGLGIYVSGRAYLPRDARSDPVPAAGTATRVEPRMLALLLLVFVLASCFIVTAGQLGNVYSLWVKAAVDRRVAGDLTIPVTWFQSLTPLASAVLTPVFIAIWRRQALRQREPALLAKMGIGLALCTFALLWLAALCVAPTAQQGVHWLWLLPVHVLVGIAYLFVYPVGLALFARVAPAGSRAAFIGIYFLTSFLASNVVGWLGGFYQGMSATRFWLLQAGIGAAGLVLVLLLGAYFGRLLRERGMA